MTTKGMKRGLLLSALALCLCFVMLLGTTFAWFTSSVTSSNNIIKAGNLDVEMYWAKGTEDPASANWADASTGAIFNYTLWEPGYAQVRHIKIENKGSLALKYQVNIIPEGDVSDLADVIDVYYADPAVQVADRAAIASMTKIGTLTEVLAGLGETGSGWLAANTADTVTIVLKMQETAGNDFMNKKLGDKFSVQLLATQYTAETDSFDDQYDKDATYPLGAEVEVSGSVDGNDITVTIPDDAPAGDYTLTVSNVNVENATGNTTMSFDIELLCDGAEVAGSGVAYDVTVQLPHPFVGGVTDVKHNGASIDNFTYDAETLTVSFTTTGFSPFSVEYVDYINPAFPLEYEKNEDGSYTITAGMFVGANPADYDASLKADDSEYIAINYEQGGKTCYAVSARATTVIVAAGAAEDYVAENGNYTVTANQSGKLYSVISALQSQDYSTVYLLPGTYTEGTTVNVFSSMDIIGLGDKEDIKVVKPAGTSKSNRHLFNCSGTKADYIEVTIRNMHLDVQGMNSANQDNAAVQSIRKTKVKCYDLIITKNNPTNMGMIALYVNGNNAVDGVKYPAYLYVENCTLDSAKAFSVVSTAGTYKFYYTDLTYNGTAYTTNNSSIKNQTMAADDWDW